MMEIYKSKRSANTQRSTEWEVKTFREWISERNSEDQVPETSLTKILQKGVLIIQIRFVVDTQRQNGELELFASYTLAI